LAVILSLVEERCRWPKPAVTTGTFAVLSMKESEALPGVAGRIGLAGHDGVLGHQPSRLGNDHAPSHRPSRCGNRAAVDREMHDRAGIAGPVRAGWRRFVRRSRASRSPPASFVSKVKDSEAVPVPAVLVSLDHDGVGAIGQAGRRERQAPLALAVAVAAMALPSTVKWTTALDRPSRSEPGWR